ncbi:MAG: hypothetical protein ABIS59_00055 [Candidatus Saccharibacteria bacterium]
MSKSTKLISGWGLWRQTIMAYRAHWRLYSIIVLVITVHAAIVKVLAPGDATITAYSSLAALIMNVALIYAIIGFNLTPDFKPSLRSLFYDSSVVLIRYVIVGFCLAIMLIPAAFGLGLVGLTSNTTTVPPLGEILLFAVIGLIIAIPSIYLLTRNGLALITVFEDDNWPMQALRKSRTLTKGHFWAVLGRNIIMALGLLIAIIPFSAIFIGLLVITQNTIFSAMYQIADTAILLPLLYTYLFKLSQALGVKA